MTASSAPMAAPQAGPDDGRPAAGPVYEQAGAVDEAGRQLARLLALMARLRDPVGGCPWDREQTFETIAPYAIEEAYEVLDTIQRQDWRAFPDELGDLLLQVVYQARMAQERGLFDFATVTRMVTEKMIRRHPHVAFGPDVLQGTQVDRAAAPSGAAGAAPQGVPDQWEKIKERERLGAGASATPPGALAGVAPSLPALLRASKLANRAARVGFDWPDVAGVLDKVREEIDEFSVEMQHGDQARMRDEMGDILFSVASLARRLKLDPEACLRQACDKFTRRFEGVEARLAAQGLSMAEQDVETLDALWRAVKTAESPAD
ncbi:MAG: nucleoside triphosphate pyrophosphohydrolase [Acetobacter sp.]